MARINNNWETKIASRSEGVQPDTVVMAVGRAVLCAPPLANPRGRIRHARRARSDAPYQRRFCPLTSNSGWFPQTTTTVSSCTRSEAGAMNETRLTSAKPAKSAVLISESGLNPKTEAETADGSGTGSLPVVSRAGPGKNLPGGRSLHSTGKMPVPLPGPKPASESGLK
jgi:hypothetical protein